MGYYIRAFCVKSDVPTIHQILTWLDKRNLKMVVDTSEGEIDIHASPWNQVPLLYKPEKLPILVECNIDEGNEECLLREEVNEFIDFVSPVGLSFAKRKVIKHLNATKFIIACQLPTSDIDDDGYKANSEFLSYFVNHNGAMIQADGEGFYEGNKLIVKVS